jgi:hypothetical protein
MILYFSLNINNFSFEELKNSIQVLLPFLQMSNYICIIKYKAHRLQPHHLQWTSYLSLQYSLLSVQVFLI